MAAPSQGPFDAPKCLNAAVPKVGARPVSSFLLAHESSATPEKWLAKAATVLGESDGGCPVLYCFTTWCYNPPHIRNHREQLLQLPQQTIYIMMKNGVLHGWVVIVDMTKI